MVTVKEGELGAGLSIFLMEVTEVVQKLCSRRAPGVKKILSEMLKAKEILPQDVLSCIFCRFQLLFVLTWLTCLFNVSCMSARLNCVKDKF